MHYLGQLIVISAQRILAGLLTWPQSVSTEILPANRNVAFGELAVNFAVGRVRCDMIQPPLSTPLALFCAINVALT
jgi:hypothetical protein